MLTLLKAIILGIIQGITEWLPISSSGHLVIAQQLMHLDVPISFDILLHLGTLLVIFMVFWKDILLTLKAFFKFDFHSFYGRLSLYIIIGSVPTAVIGFTFHDLFESFFSSLFVVAIALLVTGTLLYLTKFFNGKRNLSSLDSLFIGIFQGLAIIPGISRSGSTIGLGLLLGNKKEQVAKFSFLLSIPAILGASIFDLKDFSFTSLGTLNVIIGLITAIIVGYISLKYLLKVIMENKFYYFAYYCWILGLIILILV
jgi:undecaprenyl-diphosphatase